ncbi:triple gene block protein 3 [Elderberry carlavirus A]|uniref:triple gene block protein 3 n=1 Tax=Elderberry carlavirus A TaxID=1569052 RepID=UPI00054A80BF|nr:triple gene block protein 3 [Elderberry carlavirus A]AIZ76616.1 triple gene block protein 3 [Elderberry carlavirus A]
MRQLSTYELTVLFALSFALLSLSYYYSPGTWPERTCSVIITGESITIRACEFTKDFVDYAKSLKIPNHNLSP